jgi:hypothetical protein
MIGISGSRSVSEHEKYTIISHFSTFSPQEKIAVGDANGVDKIARDFFGDRCSIFKVEGFQKWHFAARSQRMADASDRLIAYPNQPCPDKCTPKAPFSGHGSGTWGTIAYAVKTGLPVQVVPLVKLKLPDWLAPYPEQLKLLDF